MVIDFDNIAGHSRIWIYQSNKAVELDVQQKILEKGKVFLSGWAAHGADLKASIDFRYDHFLIIALDESHAGATGCSIDKSVTFIRSAEEEYKLSFLDRTKVALDIDSKVIVKDLNVLKKDIKEGLINEHSNLFNNLIQQKKDLTTDWKIPVKDSWLGKYFVQGENVSI
ncbi:MAG: hypothetical protein AAF363_13460 [Bacteroidota bacterium]